MDYLNALIVSFVLYSAVFVFKLCMDNGQWHNATAFDWRKVVRNFIIGAVIVGLGTLSIMSVIMSRVVL